MDEVETLRSFKAKLKAPFHFVSDRKGELVEAFDIDGVLESTGAGDYYTAAFAHGVMQGFDLHYAARLGNVAGALNVTAIGAQSCVIDALTLYRQAGEAVPSPA